MTNTGTYRVFYSLNATAKNGGEVKPVVRVNNVAVEHSSVNGAFPSNPSYLLGITAYPQDFQNSVLLDLNAGDKVDLAVEFPNAASYPNFSINVAAKRAVLHAVRVK